LANYFNNIGVYHPYEMSSIILTSYYRKLKREPIDLINQVNPIRNYYKLQPILNENPNIQDSIMNLTPEWKPFDKVSHHIKCELGARYVDYQNLNTLLSKNYFPVISSPNFYASIGYFGNYKKYIGTLVMVYIPIKKKQTD
jgi:hypothetical protein